MSTYTRHRREHWGVRELWAYATPQQQSVAVGGGILLVVLGALGALDPAFLPLAAAVLGTAAVLVLRFGTAGQVTTDRRPAATSEVVWARGELNPHVLSDTRT
jgi:hypothetical protein